MDEWMDGSPKFWLVHKFLLNFILSQKALQQKRLAPHSKNKMQFTRRVNTCCALFS